MGVASPPRQSPWILGPWRDALLFFATPLLILPLAWLAKARFSLESMALFVASFGALGHHLPGMLRAYGDRELFQRFRTRFIVAPILLLVVCVTCAVREVSGLALVLYVWGIWHGLAQTYGFLRIYDAKVQSNSRWTCRLDLALCVAFFLGGALVSPTRCREILNLLYQCGLPIVSADAVTLVREGARWAVGGVIAVFLAHLVFALRAGRAPSALKLITMFTSFGFWWFANVAIENLLLGVLLFEVFHDVQYLSIVWGFNRARAAKGADLGRWNGFLFGRSAALAWLYVGLVFAYGGLNYVAKGVNDTTVRNALMGVLAASALLHFYFDGFIWKVRERATRQSLGLAGGKELAGLEVAGLTHAAKWGFLLLPLGGLAWTQGRGLADETARTDSLLAAFDQPKDHLALGSARFQAGASAEAALHFRAALARDPMLVAAHVGLGDALLAQGASGEAEGSYRRALELSDAGGAHNGLGNLLVMRGDPHAALAEYRAAVAADPGFLPALANLGAALFNLGEVAEAIEVQRAFLARDPEGADARAGIRALSTSLSEAGRADEAVRELERGHERFPDDFELGLELGDVLAQAGQGARASEIYEGLLHAQADQPDALFGLANTRVLAGQPAEAVELYQRALRARPGFPEAQQNLGVLELQLGRFENAERSLRAALAHSQEDGPLHLSLDRKSVV